MKRSNVEQRNNILIASIKIFSEKGLNGATIRAVAKSANVNSALIYYYFDNKYTLFIESIKFILRGFFGELEKEFNNFKTGEERINFLINGIFKYYTNYPERMQLISAVFVMYDNILRKIIRQFIREQAVMPPQVIADGIASGELRNINPIQAWWTILGSCMLSMKLHQITHKNKFISDVCPFPDIDEIKNGLLQIICYGINKPKKGLK